MGPEVAKAPVEGNVMDDSRWEVILWRDIDYLARVRLPYELAMDFEVFSVSGWLEGATRGEYDMPLLERKGWQASGDDTDNPDEAQVLFHGQVKWDGCSNWAWNTDQSMWHGCTPADVTNLAEAMRRVYALATERIDHWDPPGGP